MKKDKKKPEMPLKRKLIIMVLFIAMAICVIAGLFACASNAEEVNNKLTLSDWLVAACSVVALTGTLILSCITITQTAQANETNDKLFEQNKGLQKITDLQSKLSNQENYPILLAKDIKFEFLDINPDADDECFCLEETEEKFRFSDFYNTVTYCLDGRLDKKHRFGKCTKFSFDFVNTSKAKISNIAIKNIQCEYPVSFKKDIKFNHLSVMQEDNHFECKFFIYHEKDLGYIEDKISMLNIKFCIEITLVTGITFKEELRITNAQFSNPYSRVESLELIQ